jgi:hypothetical protein
VVVVMRDLVLVIPEPQTLVEEVDRLDHIKITVEELVDLEL